MAALDRLAYLAAHHVEKIRFGVLSKVRLHPAVALGASTIPCPLGPEWFITAQAEADFSSRAALDWQTQGGHAKPPVYG